MAEDGKIVYKIVIDDSGAITAARTSGTQVGSEFATGASSMEQVWTGACRRIGEAFINMAVGAVRQAKNLIVGAVQTGMEFDTAMSQVAATLGYTREQLADTTSAEYQNFQALRDFALDKGKTTAFTAIQAAEALNYMALAGYDADTSMAMLPAVLDLAAAGAMDLGRASDVVTDIQSALGLSVEETIALVDQMAKTSQKTNTSVSQLGEAMLQIGPTAKTMKGGTAEIAEVLGILASNGVKGAEGGTHLRNILLSLASPTENGAAALERLGISIFDDAGNMKSFVDLMPEFKRAMYGAGDALDEMMKAANVTTMEDLEKVLAEMTDSELDEFLNGLSQQDLLGVLDTIINKRDIASFLALINTSEDEWLRLQRLIRNESGGAAHSMAETMLDNLGGDLTLLKSAWEGFKVEFADKLTPILRQIMPQLTEKVYQLTDKLVNADWSNVGDMLLEAADKVFGFLGYLIEHGGEIIEIAKAIASPFLGIGKVLEEINKLIHGKQSVGETMDNLWNYGEWQGTPEEILGEGDLSGRVRGVGGALNSLYITSAPELGAEYQGQQLDQFGQSAQAYVDFLKQMTAGAENAEEANAQLQKDVDALVLSYGQAALENPTAFGNPEQVEAFTTELAGLTQTYLDFIANGGAQEMVDQGIATTTGDISGTVGSLTSDAKSWGLDMMGNLASGITEGNLLSVVPAVTGVASTIWSLLHHSEPETGPLAHDSEWMPDMMLGFAEQIRQYTPYLSEALNGALSIPSFGDVERQISYNISANGGGSSTVIEVPVTLNGNEIARATAWAMGEQLSWEMM